MNPSIFALSIDIIIIVTMIAKKVTRNRIIGVIIALFFLPQIFVWIFAIIYIYDASKVPSDNKETKHISTADKYIVLRDKLREYNVPTKKELDQKIESGIHLSEKETEEYNIRKEMGELFNLIDNEESFEIKYSIVSSKIESYLNPSPNKEENLLENESVTINESSNIEDNKVTENDTKTEDNEHLSIPLIRKDNNDLVKENKIETVVSLESNQKNKIKFCRFCGNKLIEGSVYCGECGKKIEQ